MKVGKARLSNNRLYFLFIKGNFMENLQSFTWTSLFSLHNQNLNVHNHCLYKPVKIEPQFSFTKFLILEVEKSTRACIYLAD